MPYAIKETRRMRGYLSQYLGSETYDTTEANAKFGAISTALTDLLILCQQDQISFENALHIARAFYSDYLRYPELHP